MENQLKSNPNIAIVGATGVVGSEFISILTERKFPHNEIRLFASASSKGEVYSVCGKEVEIEELNGADFTGIDLILGASSAELAKDYIPKAIEAGAMVVDNSSYFRMDPNVPLVVPEVNADILKTTKSKVIANPNCSTIQMMPLLNALHKAKGLERVIISTYQAVSGAGRDALDELFKQTQSVYTQQEAPSEAFMHPIAFNCIPQIDTMLDDGYTKEEHKMINESRKILDIPELRISATAVRVPVFHAHAESITVDLGSKMTVAECCELFSKIPGVKVFENPNDYPMQINAAGKDEIFVGRI
ncbi:UNVERIFIED_CONTAM: hypothetical protein GTU68_024162, partial [Idotea baltica]|nr:hypothetical protein [Idotea baltica]